MGQLDRCHYKRHNDERYGSDLRLRPEPGALELNGFAGSSLSRLRLARAIVMHLKRVTAT